MDFYEIDMKGKFWLERLASTPVYEASHEGRLIYQSTLREVLFADNIEWRPVGIPAGTKMLFYQDTAPTGWTIVTTVDDTLVYFTKGSSAGGNTGGDVKSASTWTQPNHTHSVTTNNHTHTGPSHTHTTASLALNELQMPVHTHSVTLYQGAGGSGGALYDAQGWQRSIVWGTSSAGGGQTHNHGSTGAAGTGSTGSAGGESVTSADGAPTSSWRPSGYCVIICAKN